MKLYTEEQVGQMIEKSRETGLTAEYLILTTAPIELPSDEEIDDVSGGDISFELGAKWMINKIEGGKQ